MNDTTTNISEFDWSEWKELVTPILHVDEFGGSIIYLPYVPMFVLGDGTRITGIPKNKKD